MVRFSFFAASSSVAPPARASSIWSWMSCTFVLARSSAMSLWMKGATTASGFMTSGSILSTVTSTAPNCPFTGALTSPSLSEKAASATAGSMIADFATVPRSMSGFFQSALGGERGKARPRLDALAGGLRVRHVGKDDLFDVAALRRGVGLHIFIVGLFHVRVGDLDRFRQVRRRHRQGGDLAVFGRAEHDFAVVEIFAQLFGGGLRQCRRPAPGRASDSRCCAAGSGTD